MCRSLASNAGIESYVMEMSSMERRRSTNWMAQVKKLVSLTGGGRRVPLWDSNNKKCVLIRYHIKITTGNNAGSCRMMLICLGLHARYDGQATALFAGPCSIITLPYWQVTATLSKRYNKEVYRVSLKPKVLGHCLYDGLVIHICDGARDLIMVVVFPWVVNCDYWTFSTLFMLSNCININKLPWFFLFNLCAEKGKSDSTFS